jgi:hypothetical protein
MTDYLIMLLSTDWFLPNWTEIGISIDIVKQVGIQQGCREIVDQMLSGCQDYYRSNVSPERRQETDARFLALLRKWEAESEVSEAHEKWASLSHEKLKSAFMNTSHTIDLVRGNAQESGSNLDFVIRAEVAKAWEEQHANAPRFSEICLESKSDWDAYTRSLLTSPQTLANLLNSVLRDRRFRAFWTDLRQRLTPQQLNELVSWYRAMTVNKLHEDRPDLIPAYME